MVNKSTSDAAAPLSTPIAVEESGIEIWEYLRIVRRRLLLILLTAVVVVGATAFFTLRMTKIYRATTTVRIETQAPKVLGNDVENVVEMGTGSFWSNLEYYETQYKIIESRDIALRVVRKYMLHEDPEFLGVPQEQRAEFEPTTPEKAAQALQGLVTVEPVKDSRLVKIHVDNRDPARAQLYANALAKAYLDKNLANTLQSTVDAGDWLSTQLDDARTKLNTAEQELFDFKKENSILSVSLAERQNIVTAQMTAAATSLTEARARRIEIESRKSAIAKVAENNDPLAIPLESLNSNLLIQQLKHKHGELSQQYSELSERYGKNFPQMRELKAKLHRIENDIEREVKNILRAIDAELTAARRSEAGLKRALNELHEQALALNQKEVAYNRLARERTNNESVYNLLLGRSKEADLSRMLRVNNVQILDPALLPEYPIKPRLSLNVTLALLIGLALGIALALVIEFADRSIKTQDDVEAAGIAFLGIVPSIDTASSSYGGQYGQYYGKKKRHRKSKKRKKKPVKDRGNGKAPINFDLFVHENPKSQVAESCRAIRTNLLFMSADQPAKRILITSPSPQEGKTTVAMNLAIVMAQSGAKVLIVDTDMRRPRVHRAVGMRSKQGISTAILGESTIDESILHTDMPNVDVLLCGPVPPNPAELMHTDSFARVVDALSARYDHVIFDSPPVGVVTDAAILSKLVDGTVLVVKSLQTSKDALKHAATVLKDIEANILGAVLNDLDLHNRKYGQHYYYYYYKKYGYYYGQDKTGDSGRETPPPAEDPPQLNA